MQGDVRVRCETTSGIPFIMEFLALYDLSNVDALLSIYILLLHHEIYSGMSYSETMEKSAIPTLLLR